MQEFAFQRTFGPTPKFKNVQSYKNYQDFAVVAGPCSVETEAQIHALAYSVKQSGATHLRGGVFRGGTYPSEKHRFGWVDQDLIVAYYEAAKSQGLKNIIEVLDYTPESFKRIVNFCDAFQVGARSMQNYSLLRKLGEFGKPVFLKRNTGATMDEFLGAAEHLLVGGVKELTLIERGSSTHMNHVRWDLSLSIIPAIKAITEIPVIVDGAHGTGRRDLVEPMALAGVAAGAGGILVEVHEHPEISLSDPEQAISPESFSSLMKKVNRVREAIA